MSDFGNHAIRCVTIAGVVNTVADNGEKGFVDGVTAAARFKWTYDLVVDGEGVIVVADTDNHRRRKIVVGQVTTVAVRSEPGTADGADTVARFNGTHRLALDERGSLLVVVMTGGEGKEDTLRVVEASLAPLMRMGPVEEAAQDSEAMIPAKTQAKFADYGMLVEDGALADVVLTCYWWRGSVSLSTGVCLRSGSSISGGCSCRGYRGGVRRVGCTRLNK